MATISCRWCIAVVKIVGLALYVRAVLVLFFRCHVHVTVEGDRSDKRFCVQPNTKASTLVFVCFGGLSFATSWWMLLRNTF